MLVHRFAFRGLVALLASATALFAQAGKDVDVIIVNGSGTLLSAEPANVARTEQADLVGWQRVYH